MHHLLQILPAQVGGTTARRQYPPRSGWVRLIASDADDAKEIVSRIVTDAGLRPIDAGPLRRARELEALGYLHMAVQQPLGTGFCSAVKILA